MTIRPLTIPPHNFHWFCVGSGRHGGCSAAFFLSSFGVMVAELLVLVSRRAFRLLIILCLCRYLLRGVSRPHSGVLPTIWGFYSQFEGSTDYLKSTCLFENTRGFRKVRGVIRRVYGWLVSLLTRPLYFHFRRFASLQRSRALHC
jgi:hypothetical protein